MFVRTFSTKTACCGYYGQFYKNKLEHKVQESIQSSTTPGPGYQWESNKLIIRHHKREPIGQVSRFPACYHNFYSGIQPKLYQLHICNFMVNHSFSVISFELFTYIL